VQDLVDGGAVIGGGRLMCRLPRGLRLLKLTVLVHEVSVEGSGSSTTTFASGRGRERPGSGGDLAQVP
jgi:hypothetical protein